MPITDSSLPSRFPPTAILAIAFGIGLSVVIAVIVLALRQPSLGLSFLPSADGASVLVQSPELGEDRQVTGMVWEGGSFELLPLDLTVEPDGAMGDYASYDTFLDRQQTLSDIQRADHFTLLTEQDEILVQPSQKGRSFFSLPQGFWVQIVVGLLAFLVSAGVFAFRSGSAAARYLLFSGASTLLFAPAAALYSTRELALPGELFRWANDLNFLGGSLFAASFVALLLHYPRKLAPWWVGFSVVGLFVVWWVAQQVGVFESMTFARRFLVMIAVLATFILAGVHWFGTRRDPVGRAALKWFLLSWVMGTGLFAVGILLPQLFGVDTSRFQGYAFLLFLLVYAGLAFGIIRYRLFDLGEWWRQILIWGTLVLLLVTLYFSLVTGLQLPPGLSLALALLLGGVFRIIMRNRLRGREGPPREDLFASVLDVAFGPDDELEKRWKELFAGLFHPLGLEVVRSSPRSVTIADDGASMLVPGFGTASTLRIEFPEKGGRLFSHADAALATESWKMLQHALESRESYERGVTEERSRIALDIHDNIASGLLTALHSPDAGRKDQCIRDTMTEIREMIRNASSEGLTLEEALAELRMETAERLSAASITLGWCCDEIFAEVLGSAHVHALRSVIREAVSNIIKHSAASHAEVSLSLHGKTLELKISDNGRGFETSQASTGSGLANFRERLRPFSGEVEVSSSASGTLLSAWMKLKVEDCRT